MARYRRTFSRTALPFMIILPVFSLEGNVAEAIFQIVSGRRRWRKWFPDRKAPPLPLFQRAKHSRCCRDGSQNEDAGAPKQLLACRAMVVKCEPVTDKS